MECVVSTLPESVNTGEWVSVKMRRRGGAMCNDVPSPSPCPEDLWARLVPWPWLFIALPPSFPAAISAAK